LITFAQDKEIEKFSSAYYTKKNKISRLMKNDVFLSYPSIMMNMLSSFDVSRFSQYVESEFINNMRGVMDFKDFPFLQNDATSTNRARFFYQRKKMN
jgi:hypothetical protein